MGRFLKALVNDPLFPARLVYRFLQAVFLRCAGYRTVVYNMHHDYFFDIFKPVYDRLLEAGKVAAFFSFSPATPGLKGYLAARVPGNRLVPDHVSPFVPYHLFLCAEVSGPDFPLGVLRTKTVEMYHGTGTNNLYTKKREVMRRFDIHFAIGPHMNRYLDTCFHDDPKKVYDVGFPKTDAILADRTGDRALYDEFGLDGKTVVLYAPHWNPFGSLHVFEEGILTALVRSGAEVIVKIHNYLLHEFPEKRWYERLCRAEEEYANLHFYKKAATQPLFPVADMMVTDPGTTSAVEFCLLGKPLLMYDSTGWFDSRIEVEREVERDTLETALRFTSTEGLAELVAGILENRPGTAAVLDRQKIRQRELIGKYLHNPGRAAPAAVKAVLRELGL